MGCGRVSRPSEAADAASGITLAIVKRLRDLLDAAVELETLPDRSTRFGIQLPAKYPDLREEPPSGVMDRSRPALSPRAYLSGQAIPAGNGRGPGPRF
jgi:hypothetical protein